VKDALIDLALEESTAVAYRAQVVRFESEFGAMGTMPRATLVDTVLLFAADAVLEHQYARARLAVTALAYEAGVRRGLALFEEPAVRAFLKGLEKAKNLRALPEPKRDLVPAWAIVKFVGALSPPMGLSFWDWTAACAMIAVGVRCIRRPGELADMREDQLECTDFGAQIRIVVAKTDPTAQGKWIPMERGTTVACPVRCLDRYLAMAKRCSLKQWKRGSARNFLFVRANGRPYTTEHIKDFIRAVAAFAGLKGKFGGHSIRITGACLAVLGGMSLEQVKAIGGWRSNVVETYLRGLVAVASGASARMGL
jgi:hypothetical protein